MFIEQVQIFNIPVKVRESADIDGMGEYQDFKQEILIAANLPPEQKLDTLWHEIFHAICARTCPNLDDAVEEQVVTALSSGMLTVLKQNPNLVAWFPVPQESFPPIRTVPLFSPIPLDCGRNLPT